MKEIRIEARKLDGSVHREWAARLIEETPELYTLYGTFDQEIAHPEIGHIAIGTGSFEYYWKDQGYNVFRFIEPDGRLKCFYCNVNLPPKLEGNCLSYIDLDLDILVSPDFSYRLLDAEEFERNALNYGYQQSLKQFAHKQIDLLVSLIEKREFPFFADRDFRANK